MKAKDPAKLLMKNPEMDVMVLDGSNGAGFPRTINFGPRVHEITYNEHFNCSDCEGRVDEDILIIGYGCY